MSLTRLTTESELPGTNEAKEFPCGDKSVCVANVDGRFHAIDNVCPHRGGPLAQGMIENGKIVCPWHAWAWDPISGAEARNPNVKVAVYPMKIEDGDVLVEI